MKLLIFSHQKCLDSVLLNILGFQSFRYTLGKTLYWLKYNFFNKKKENVDENLLSEVYQKGYAQKENFLEDDEFHKIKKEFDIAIFESNSAVEKDSYDDNKKLHEAIEHRTFIVDETCKDKYPALYKLKNNSYIKNLFSSLELKKNVDIFCRLERIYVINNKIHDNNRDFHYDTFHNTFKAWLFLDDVKEDNGPYHQIPYSHKFQIKRFFFEWWRSILYALKISSVSSFRVEQGDKPKLREFYYDKSIKAIVPKNTLVCANPHGLHRRGDAKNDSVRVSVQFWTRENPLKIFL